jgi:uncharacterized protein YjlB
VSDPPLAQLIAGLQGDTGAAVYVTTGAADVVVAGATEVVAGADVVVVGATEVVAGADVVELEDETELEDGRAEVEDDVELVDDETTATLRAKLVFGAY